MPVSLTVRAATPGAAATARSRRLMRAGWVAIAALATGTIWVIAVPVAGAHLSARLGAPAATQQVGLATILTVSVLAGLAGWALLAALERFATRPARSWIALATLALAISLAGPLSAGTSTPSKLVLVGMHLAVGGIVIPALAKTSARR